jgi:hypothetical protein
MVQAEYNALVKLQPDMPLETYTGLSSVGPVSLLRNRTTWKGRSNRLLVLFHVTGHGSFRRTTQALGVDLNRGCRAMVPILDMYDHHGMAPNVEWRYDQRSLRHYRFASDWDAPNHL